MLCLDAPDGERLVSGGMDGSVRLWDLSAGRAARALLLDGSEVNCVCLGRSGEANNFVWAAAGAEVCGFDLRAPGMVLREPVVRLCANREEIGHLALNPSGMVLAAADDSGDVQLFDLDAGRQLAALEDAHDSLCSCVAFNPGRDWELCTGGMDTQCKEWDFRRTLLIQSWSLAPPPERTSGQLLNPRHVHCLSYAPGGGVIAIALGDGSIELRQSGTGEVITVAEAHRAATSQAYFAPQLATSLTGAVPLISAGDDRQLRLWMARGLRPTASGAASAKRHRGVGTGEALGVDEDDDEMSYEAPALQPIASLNLEEKPNWIAPVSLAGSGTGAVCIASNAEGIMVLPVNQGAFV